MHPKKILFILLIIFLIACDKPIDTNMPEPMTNFEFTTQDEKTLSL